MDDNTIICRCEDLTLGELRRRIQEGYISWEELKRITRCGMGSCQGKTCRTLILRELAQAGYKEPFTPNSFRQPIAPVTLGDLTRAGGDEQAAGGDHAAGGEHDGGGKHE